MCDRETVFDANGDEDENEMSSGGLTFRTYYKMVFGSCIGCATHAISSSALHSISTCPCNVITSVHIYCYSLHRPNSVDF